ncbi:MAG: DNA-directed RNA polymerase subunit omega [Apilactobacillus sp.]|uniref:DNA-directed RNA polymerase subunit omega n=1 Tax=Apilactobacillus TaxID=2767877 RepID=UPI0025D0F8C9|nr:DNA-directed RNA polymerase subunit omega [Apilactobacillus sp.]MCT6822358.1 DNA-directed RNA polymerase subunit omega [Apilactobacillus sp.]MCT6857700.1 DNA-directed RNA polymerase subunit omega [Apilactobacillus sp.]
MLLYPSVDKLLERVDSRYSLIMLASKRAHDIDAGSPLLLDEYKSRKTVGKAFEEIADGKVELTRDKK